MASLQWIISRMLASVAAWRRQRAAQETYRALRALDGRTLRDLGLDASEAASIARELSEPAERTRIHALATLRQLGI